MIIIMVMDPKYRHHKNRATILQIYFNEINILFCLKVSIFYNTCIGSRTTVYGLEKKSLSAFLLNALFDTLINQYPCTPVFCKVYFPSVLCFFEPTRPPPRKSNDFRGRYATRRITQQNRRSRSGNDDAHHTSYIYIPTFIYRV